MRKPRPAASSNGIAIFLISLSFTFTPASHAQEKLLAANRPQNSTPQHAAAEGQTRSQKVDEIAEGQDLVRKRMEWFYHQRAYPLGYIPAHARLRALKELDETIKAQ